MLGPTNLAGLRLKHQLMNAAGTCKTEQDVAELAESAVSAIVVGSVTVQPREGNAGTTYWADAAYSLHSQGLPNPGMEYYRTVLPGMVATAHAAGKPLILSVVGFGRKEYRRLGALAKQTGVDAVELNLGCPNVIKEGVHGRITTYDPEAVAEATYWTADGIDGACPMFVKLSYIPDLVLMNEVCRVLSTKRGVSGVVSLNTFAGGLEVTNGKPLLTPTLGDVSGAMAKPLAMGQIWQLRQMLPKRLVHIGVGGIRNVRDIKDYMAAGAIAVQAATPFWNAGQKPDAFGDILSA